MLLVNIFDPIEIYVFIHLNLNIVDKHFKYTLITYLDLIVNDNKKITWKEKQLRTTESDSDKINDSILLITQKKVSDLFEILILNLHTLEGPFVTMPRYIRR